MRRRGPAVAPSAADKRRTHAFYGLEEGQEPVPATTVVGGGRTAGRKRERKPQGLVLTAQAPSEGQVQAFLMKFLDLDPRVAFVERHNSGAAYDSGGRFIRFISGPGGRAVPGYPDLGGVMSNGLRLAIECKAPGSWRREEWFIEHDSWPDHELSEAQARLMAQWRRLRAEHAAGAVAFACDTTDPVRIGNGMSRKVGGSMLV